MSDPITTRDRQSNYRDDGAMLDRHGNEVCIGPYGSPQRPADYFEYKGDNPVTEEIRRVYHEIVHARWERDACS